MTDEPDQITWVESGIIIKQLIVIVVTVGSIAGVVFSPQQIGEITTVTTALVTVIFSVWTIHNRLTKNCPPITKQEK